MKIHPASLCVCLLLTLTVGAHADSLFGNQFMIGSPPIQIAVDPVNNQWTRFTSWNKTTVTAADVFLGESKAASAVVGLQPDKDGVPSGRYLVSGTLSTPQSGWNRITFPTPVNLEADHVYYLVMTVPDGTINWTAVNLANRGTQPSGAQDPAWAHGSGSTVDTRLGPAYLLEASDGRNLGQPYTLRYNSPVLGGKKIPAQRFVFQPASGGGETVAAVSLALGIATNEAVTYKVALLDAKNAIIESKEVTSADLPAGPPKIVTIPLAGTTRLTPGETYSLAFYSEAVGGKASWVGAATTADQTAEKATWQGVEGYAFTYEGTDLKTEGPADVKRDLVFYFDMQ